MLAWWLLPITVGVGAVALIACGWWMHYWAGVGCHENRIHFCTEQGCSKRAHLTLTGDYRCRDHADEVA